MWLWCFLLVFWDFIEASLEAGVVLVCIGCILDCLFYGVFCSVSMKEKASFGSRHSVYANDT
jgi:hypothetical protein